MPPATPAAYRPGMPAPERQADGRVYLIYLNGATAGNTPLVRRLATEFVSGYLQPGDRAAIWDPQYPARAVAFTGDKAALLADIEPYTGVGSANDLPFAFGSQMGAAYRGEAGQQEQCQAVLREPYGNLRKAIDWFNGIQGRRKSIILFAGGWLGPTDPSTRADITLYAVDVRGLVAPDYQTMSGARSSGAGAAAAIGAGMSLLSESADGMRTLANRTGGFAIINYNNFKPGFQRIVEANSQYYVLGYASSYTRRDRVFRDLDVTVKRPGVHVSARRGYFPRQ